MQASACDLPPFDDDERALVRKLLACKAASIAVPRDARTNEYRAADRLVGSGWCAAWIGDRGELRVTFTVLGARGLGVTLLGEPSRWLPIGTREKSDYADKAERKGTRLVFASELAEDFDLDHLPAEGPAEGPAEAPAQQPSKKAKETRPFAFVGMVAVFRADTPRDAPCGVCGGSLAVGSYCLACDRYHAPGAAATDDGISPALRKLEARKIAAASLASTRRARRQQAKQSA